ncbi:MAG: hypothetical protein ABI771_12585 [Betaproteobacteria bacterium]
MKLRNLLLPVLAAVAAALVATTLAFAHSESAGTSEGLLDCEHPPKNIALKLPKDIAVAATIICTPSTQLISAKEGWAWRYPASYFDRPSIPAYAPALSRSQAGGRYFTGFKTSQLSKAEIDRLHVRFTGSLPTYSDRKPPARVVLLTAKNDLGHSVEAYFGFDSKDDGWVAMCAPECAPEYFFLINRQQ